MKKKSQKEITILQTLLNNLKDLYHGSCQYHKERQADIVSHDGSTNTN